jgi:hypothetical protein
LDGDFVPLNGPALWLLWAPAQRVQDPSDMVGMIANPYYAGVNSWSTRHPNHIKPVKKPFDKMAHDVIF